MGKFESNVIKNIKTISLNMENKKRYDNSYLTFISAPIMYSLFMNHMTFDINNPNWINRDRLIISKEFYSVYFAVRHLFDKRVTLDVLDEIKQFGISVSNKKILEIENFMPGDIVSSSAGIALGERYIESLIKIENPKSNLINFNTYTLCTYKDLLSGLGYETLSYVGKEKLNKLIYIVIKDELLNDSLNKEIYTEDINKYKLMGFNIINIEGNNYSLIDEAIEEAKDSKKPSIIVVDTSSKKIEQEYNKEIEKKLAPEGLSVELCSEINKRIEKRLLKKINAWAKLKNECLNDLKLKELINFLETKTVKISYDIDKMQINDNYEEQLIIGNNKIFNLFAKKSPFILTASNDNFKESLCKIDSSNSMSVNSPTGRNILFGKKTLAMAGICNGLANFGFKIFVNSPLIDSNILRPFIKASVTQNLSIVYNFINDTFLLDDVYEEINSLRIIPGLVTLRPADINEIVGMYNIFANYNKCFAIILGGNKVKKLTGTNPKYVMAGAYRVKREKGEATATILASGTEVSVALRLAEELLNNDIDLRVVSIPSKELFELQKDRYRYSLIPVELDTFVLEFGDSSIWYKYATSEDHILCPGKNNELGTKEELLKSHNLDVDSLKRRIIELLKK